MHLLDDDSIPQEEYKQAGLVPRHTGFPINLHPEQDDHGLYTHEQKSEGWAIITILFFGM